MRFKLVYKSETTETTDHRPLTPDHRKKPPLLSLRQKRVISERRKLIKEENLRMLSNFVTLLPFICFTVL